MDDKSANPAVDLLHFAYNLSGIQLHVDLGVRREEYPDPRHFLAIQQACGSDAVYARFAAIFLDFERGLKSSEAGLKESLELITSHARVSYHKLELLRKHVEPFFPPTSRLEPAVSASVAHVCPPQANGGVDLQCDEDVAISDSTVTISSCSISSDVQCGDTTRRESSQMAGSDGNTTWARLEQKLIGILLQKASVKLSKHIVKFFHQARRKLRDRAVYLEFLRALELHHDELIDDFELRILVYSYIKSAEKATESSRIGSGNEKSTRGGTVSAVSHHAGQPDDKFTSRLQDNSCKSARRISEGFRSKVRVEPVEDVSDEDASCEIVLKNQAVNSGGSHAEGVEDAPSPSATCSLDFQRSPSESDCPPTHPCMLCEESVTDSLECSSLMNRLELIYSPHGDDCVCGTMEDGQMGRRTQCSDDTLRIPSVNTMEPRRPYNVRNRLGVESDYLGNEERRTTRSRKPSMRFLESFQS